MSQKNVRGPSASPELIIRNQFLYAGHAKDAMMAFRGLLDIL